MPTSNNITNWLPTTLKEMRFRDWTQPDVILFSGDAYVDHPAFGSAVIGRTLEAEGFKVVIVPQPNWQDDLRDFKKFGKPKLFFGVTAGNMDSMVNHYTANKRLRSNDAYSPGGQAGFRPDYATTVYSSILKKLFPETPIVIGGIEASLRRFTHYDYWQNKLLPSILFDSQADLLIYGNGEFTISQLAKLIEKGVDFSAIKNLAQTAYLTDYQHNTKNAIKLHSHADCLKSKKKFAKNFNIIEIQSNSLLPAVITQKIKNKILVVNPPLAQISQKNIDKIYSLPYTRKPHPKYRKRGIIPAYEMIKFSVNMHRGCFGGCSFCTISAHQGKFIISRSEKSILNEVKIISEMPDFKGHISDLGGPSANMYKMQGENIEICKKCIRPSCIFPHICGNLNTNHSPLTEIYKKVRSMSKIKKATIGSGIRYDLLFDRTGNISSDKKIYAEELIKHHVSGRLKVAPEHSSDAVLKIMRKPSFAFFHKFKLFFDKINKKAGLNQQIIPYFISSHPGSTNAEMAELAVETKKLKLKPEQIQDLTPTPLTAAAVMFYTGICPDTLKPIYTAKTKNEKLNQRMFLFWYKPENKNKIINILTNLNRLDLLGKLFKIK